MVTPVRLPGSQFPACRPRAANDNTANFDQTLKTSNIETG
jgi:hypothetical protein